MSLCDLLPWKWGEKQVAVQPAVSPAMEVGPWGDIDRVFDGFLSPWEGLTGFSAAFEP